MLDPVTYPVVIVGAGMAGLACALRLQQRGIRALVLESSDRVGGRIATDRHQGFLLDRGFQVLLTAYPECSRMLDYRALQLACFHSGAKVRQGRKLQTLGDPIRHPGDAVSTLLASVASLGDKLRILRLRARVTLPTLEEVLGRVERSTLDYLLQDGFSRAMIDGFFRPFLGGIFLENQLATSSRKFEFVFRMFSQGGAALPRFGMAEIPRQLQKRLAPDQIRLNQRVVEVRPGSVRLADGSVLVAHNIVIATNPWSVDTLLGRTESRLSTTIAGIYFSCDVSPVQGPWLVLNGEESGPINNLTVPSQLHRTYAPAGKHLVSISVVDPRAAASATLEEDVRQQATQWFGKGAQSWQHLRTYRIANPVPLQTAGQLDPIAKPSKIADGLFTCGDNQWVASIEGALRSGLATASEVAR